MRARLLPGHLAPGVVAHQRRVGDAAVDARLGRGHPLLEPGGGLLDPVAQLHEGLLDLGGVGHQVGLLLPSTVRWAARSRRSLTASTIAHSSATAPRPAPASATIPWVVVRSSTRPGY